MIDITELKAKSNPIQTIKSHTDLLLLALETFNNLYPNKLSKTETAIIRIAAENHDLGKSIYPFQSLMKNDSAINFDVKNDIIKFYKNYADSQHIPHGYLSPAFLDLKKIKTEYGDVLSQILINAIFYHHTRKYPLTDTDIINILNNDLRKRYPERKFTAKYASKVYYNGQEISESEWEQYAVVKGMLNRLDYWASANTDIDFEIDPKQNDNTISEIVENKLLAEFGSVRKLQSYMCGHKDENLAVVASTGIGKTEAALMWIGEAKAFYTLPLIVSINAIYDRIVMDIGYSKDKVSLLHSDAMAYLMQNEDSENEDAQLKYDTTRKFSYPLTVCTVDQLFTFVYKYRGCEQLLATLKYSKLIIDEIQAYSPAIVAKIIYGLKLITDIGGKFAIITATMPPVFKHFMEENSIPCTYSNPFLLDKKRHLIQLCTSDNRNENTDFNYEDMIKAGTDKKILVLCNTVKKAQKVYEILSKAESSTNVFLLHSQFIKKHRKMIEDKIMKFSDRDRHPESGIWVSTQIVEASLDIDFDILFTEMCTADSLLQRMGRCYRKREYNGEEPNILIYDTKNGVGEKSVYDPVIYERSIDFLRNFSGKIFTEENKIEYINDVFDKEGLEGTKYFKEIRDILKECSIAPFDVYDEDTAMKKFRDISAVTVIPDRIYQENLDQIKDWINIIMKKSSKDKQQRSLDNKNRIKAKESLNGLTMSLQKYSTKAKERDYTQLAPKIEIYISRLDYDFDINLCRGEGLRKERESKPNFI